MLGDDVKKTAGRTRALRGEERRAGGGGSHR